MADKRIRWPQNNEGASRLLVDQGDGTHAERVVARPPTDLITGSDADVRPRIRTENGDPMFHLGREFRTFHEFSLSGNSELIVRAVVPLNVVLHRIDTTIVSGELKVYTLLADGTEGGTFGTTLPVICTNTTTEVPPPVYTPQVVLTTGGTYTGGTEIDLFWLKTESNSQKAISVGADPGGIRGIPASTYYFRVQSPMGSPATDGVFRARWEERDLGY